MVRNLEVSGRAESVCLESLCHYDPRTRKIRCCRRPGGVWIDHAHRTGARRRPAAEAAVPTCLALSAQLSRKQSAVARLQHTYMQYNVENAHWHYWLEDAKVMRPAKELAVAIPKYSPLETQPRLTYSHENEES